MLLIGRGFAGFNKLPQRRRSRSRRWWPFSSRTSGGLRLLADDDEEKEKPAVSHAPTLEDELAYIEKLIDEWQDAATPEQMHLFYKKRAQLKGRIEEEKNRSS